MLWRLRTRLLRWRLSRQRSDCMNCGADLPAVPVDGSYCNAACQQEWQSRIAY